LIFAIYYTLAAYADVDASALTLLPRYAVDAIATDVTPCVTMPLLIYAAFDIFFFSLMRRFTLRCLLLILIALTRVIYFAICFFVCLLRRYADALRLLLLMLIIALMMFAIFIMPCLRHAISNVTAQVASFDASCLPPLRCLPCYADTLPCHDALLGIRYATCTDATVTKARVRRRRD